MPRLANRLTDMICRRAKPDPEGNKTLVLPDGLGLRLVVTPAGRKHFEFKSATGGTERTVRLGAYPDVSLEAARRDAGRLRQLAREGQNPVQVRQVERIRNRTKAGATFESIAEELLASKKKNCSPTYLRKISGGIRANLYPLLGNLPIQEIDSPILREALRKIESRGALEMLGNVRRWAGEVFDLAKANGQFVGDNPAQALLRNIFQKHEAENMRALAWTDVGQFWRELDLTPGDPATIAAIKLLVLTACRPGEVRGARWEEFDFDRARWTIPAERMKMGKPHAVPLSRQVLAILSNLKGLTGDGEYLFPAKVRGGKLPTISDMTLLKAVKRATGRDVHAHGMRALFSTHVAESGKWADNVKEAALAHGKKGIEGAYDRATHYLERVRLMQWYADEIEQAGRGADVVPLMPVAGVA
jgi:integrase